MCACSPVHPSLQSCSLAPLKYLSFGCPVTQTSQVALDKSFNLHLNCPSNAAAGMTAVPRLSSLMPTCSKAHCWKEFLLAARAQRREVQTWFPPPREDPHARSTLRWAERGQSAGRARWSWLLEQGPTGTRGRRLGQQQAHTWQPGRRGWVPAVPWWLQTRSPRSTAPGTPLRLPRKEFGYEEAFMLE